MSWTEAYNSVLETIKKRSRTQNDILKELIDRGWKIEASEKRIVIHGQGWVTIDIANQVVEFASSSCWHDFTIEELLAFAEILKIGKGING